MSIQLCLHKSRSPGDACWENPSGKTGEISQRMRTEPNPDKGMTPPSTQNLKALGSFLYVAQLSFLLNVGLRLTLGYLTISPSSESPFHIGTLPL